MLGNSTTQNTFKNSYAIETTPKALIEWNHNTYSKPRLCGSIVNTIGDTSVPNLSNLITLTEKSGPTFQSSFRGGLNISSKSLSVTTQLASDSHTPIGTELVSFPANRDLAYKITFFAKTTSTTLDSFMLLFSESIESSSLLTGLSRKFSVNSVGWTFNELFYSPADDQCTSVTMSILAEDSALINISDLSVAMVSRNEYKKQHLFKVSDVFMSNRPGEELSNNSIDRELSKVVYRAIGKKDHLYSQSISAARSGNVVTVTANTNLKPGEWVTISGFTSTKAAMNGRYQVYSSNSTQFTYLTKTSGTLAYTSGGTATFLSCADGSSVSKKILGSSQGRIYLPGSDRLSYYIDSCANQSSVSGVFAYYDKALKVNKIVIKTLNSGENTVNPEMNSEYGNTLVEYNLHTYYNGSWNTYTGSGMDKNGYLALYWNGATWTPDVSTSIIDESDYSITNSTTIEGIAFTVNAIGYVASGTNYTFDGSDELIKDTTVRYLELSPRLELDMSNYLVGFDSGNETDSGNLPVPIGLATANNSSVEFENIVREYNGETFSIFSDTSNISPISNLIKRDAKIKISYAVDLENINFFTGYVDSWRQGEETTSANMYDYAKILQKKRSRDLLVFGSDLSLKEVVTELLEQNGFSDYLSIPEMNESVMTFYSEPEKTVWENLQELLLPYAYIAFFNESGILRVTSHRELSSNSHTFVFTDDNSYSDATGSYLANIESLEVSKTEQPSEINIRYSSISRNSSADIGVNDIKDNKSFISTANQVVWSSPEQGLGYADLAASVSPTDTVIVLDTKDWESSITKQWVSFSGYIMIGSEIASFDGLEYSFGDNYRVVKSAEDYETFKKEVLAENAAIPEFKFYISPTGRIMNVERGLFGTKAQAHYVSPTITDMLTNTPSLKAFTQVDYSPSIQTSTNYLTTHLVGSTRVLRVNGKSNSINTKTLAVFQDVDSNLYDNYMLSFELAGSNASNSSDDSVGFVIGYDYNTGDGIYLEIPSETNKTGIAKLIIRGNGNTSIFTSSSKLNNFTKAKKEVKNKKGKVTKKAVPASWNKLQSLHVNIYSNGNVAVKLNGTQMSFKNSSGKNAIPYYQFSRASKSIAVYSLAKNSIDINSISAWKKGSVMVGPHTVVREYNSSALLNGGVIDQVQPFYFNAQSYAVGIGIFDIQYTTGPGYNPVVYTPQGSFQIKDEKDKTKLKTLVVPASTMVASTVESSGYRARFVLINTGTTYVPLNTTDTFSGLMISAKVMVKSNERLLRHKIYDSLQASQPIELSSDWIQSESQAKKSAQTIANGIAISSDTYTISVFGNPLIQIGDVVKLKYKKANILDDSKYVVIASSNTYDQGFATNITLRKITV